MDRLAAAKTRAPARWRPRYALRPTPAGRPGKRVRPECSAGRGIAAGGGRLRNPASVQGAPGRRTEEVSGRAGSEVGKPCGHECPAPVTSTPNRHGHVFALASRPRSPSKRLGRRDAYARPLNPTETPPARSPSGFAAIWNPQARCIRGRDHHRRPERDAHCHRAVVRPGPGPPRITAASGISDSGRSPCFSGYSDSRRLPHPATGYQYPAMVRVPAPGLEFGCFQIAYGALRRLDGRIVRVGTDASRGWRIQGRVRCFG